MTITNYELVTTGIRDTGTACPRCDDPIYSPDNRIVGVCDDTGDRVCTECAGKLPQALTESLDALDAIDKALFLISGVSMAPFGPDRPDLPDVRAQILGAVREAVVSWHTRYQPLQSEATQEAMRAIAYAPLRALETDLRALAERIGSIATDPR